ncbi:MAG TPA: hypothetical protein VES02_17645 [Dermatophilaceae bacterium]|nr:hypothetical protein [Dermatophilaceae bacterium]
MGVLRRPTPETIRAVGDVLPEPGENIDSTVKLPGGANNHFHTADLREWRSYGRGLRDRW